MSDSAGGAHLADDSDEPLNLVVDPDPRHWSLIEFMEVRREFGYEPGQWQAALKDSPELALIGSAWLALRKHRPGITWKEAGELATMGDVTPRGDGAGQSLMPALPPVPPP